MPKKAKPIKRTIGSMFIEAKMHLDTAEAALNEARLMLTRLGRQTATPDLAHLNAMRLINKLSIEPCDCRIQTDPAAPPLIVHCWPCLARQISGQPKPKIKNPLTPESPANNGAPKP